MLKIAQKGKHKNKILFPSIAVWRRTRFLCFDVTLWGCSPRSILATGRQFVSDKNTTVRRSILSSNSIEHRLSLPSLEEKSSSPPGIPDFGPTPTKPTEKNIFPGTWNNDIYSSSTLLAYTFSSLHLFHSVTLHLTLIFILFSFFYIFLPNIFPLLISLISF